MKRMRKNGTAVKLRKIQISREVMHLKNAEAFNPMLVIVIVTGDSILD